MLILFMLNIGRSVVCNSGVNYEMGNRISRMRLVVVNMWVFCVII